MPGVPAHRTESCLGLTETPQAQVGKRSQKREARALRSLLTPSAAPHPWDPHVQSVPRGEGTCLLYRQDRAALSLPPCPELAPLTPWRLKNLAAPLLPLTLT